MKPPQEICCLSWAVISNASTSFKVRPGGSLWRPSIFRFSNALFVGSAGETSTTHESPASSQPRRKEALEKEERRYDLSYDQPPARVGGNTWGVNYNHHDPRCTFAIYSIYIYIPEKSNHWNSTFFAQQGLYRSVLFLLNANVWRPSTCSLNILWIDGQVAVWHIWYTPPRTYMTGWKIHHEWRCISYWKWVVFQCHVSFQGCN